MGGISGEVGEVDILAVCLNSYRGLGYKIVNISRTIGWIDFKLGQDVAEGVPNHQVMLFLH